MKSLITIFFTCVILLHTLYSESNNTFYGGDIFVTATRTPKNIWEIPGNSVLISAQELKIKNIDEIADSLKTVSGTKIIHYGGKGSLASVNFRGLDSTHTLVMLDGIPINSPDIGSVDLGGINTENIEQIEIVKGPYSSLYGENAVSGAINLITKKLKKENRSEITIENESSEFSKISFTDHSYKNNTNYLFNAAVNDIEPERDNSFYKSSAFKIKTDHLINKNEHFIFNAQYTDKETGTPGAKPSADRSLRSLSEIHLGNDEVSNLKDRSKEKHYFVSLQRTFNDLDIKAFWDKNKKKIYQWFAFNDLNGNITSSETIYDHIPESKGIELQYNTFFTEKDIFTAGLSLIAHDYDYYTSAMEFDSKKITRSLFLQDEIQAYEKMKYVIGLRYDAPQNYAAQFSPRISATYKKNDRTSFTFSAGKAYKTPSLSDLNWPDSISVTGNEDLNAERSYSYELMTDRKINEKLSLTGCIFFQRTKDMIKWAPNGPMNIFGTPKWQPSNIGIVNTTGFELSSKIRCTDHFNSAFSYTFLDSEQKNNELINSISYEMKRTTRRSSFTPKHMFNLDLFYNTLRSIDIVLNFQYVSEIHNYYTDWASSDPITGTIQTKDKKLSSYQLCNVTINKKIDDSSKLFIEINNIFNEKYNVQFGSSLNDQDYPMPGTNIRTGYRFMF